MKKLYYFHYCIFLLVVGLKSIMVCGQTTAPSHYFRSAKPGLWDLPNTWESSADGVTNWIPSASTPTAAANTITVRSGHSVTISNNTTADQVIIASGGILEVATGPGYVLTINDGQGADITVQNGGVLKQTGISLPLFIGSAAALEVQSGGMLEAANNNVNASDYANTSSDIASKVSWFDNAVFNWNNTVNPASGVTYFPASPAIPIFRFTSSASIGGTVPTIINGLLEAIAEVTFANSGKKTFRNGIIGTGKVGVTSESGGKFIINGITATLGGSGAIALSDNGLIISAGTALTLTSNKTINNYSNGITTSTGTIKDSGTIIAGDYVISGNSTVQITGTVKTTNVNGLSEGSNTTFATASGFTVNTPGSYSVIEYNRGGNQTVTPLTYKNLIISGNGTKTIARGADIFVSGTLNITAGNTFALNGVNDLNLSGGGIVNINNNAVFDNGGESEVSGGSSPVINIAGTFITRDEQGFSEAKSSISGTNIAINILPGSTIEYGRNGAQMVTKRTDYQNITFSGSGFKTLPTCNPNGTVTIKDNATADASNKTFGGDSVATTNLTMTGGRLIVGGTGTKPDMLGRYNLTGGVIEFTNSGLTKETIRSTPTYYNIEVSGTNVGNSNGITTLSDGGSFTVNTGGIYENTADRIDGTKGVQSFTMKPGSTFKTGVKGGLSGNDTAALRNIENLIIDPKSTVIYSRSGDQTITPLLPAYPNLLLKGSGIKTVAQGIVTLSPIADSVVIDTTVILKINSGAKIDFQNRPVIIHSSAGSTGIIGEIADGSSAFLNATKVTAERFIPARRATRFISPSVTTTTSIKDNWMEGAVNESINPPFNNPHPGYGTNITGRNSKNNGFDATITSNPSLYTFDTATQHWDTVLNTNGILSAGKAYRLTVRGDRSIDMRTNNPTATNTILRASGKLYAGDFTPVLSTIDKSYTFIGNPYASSVDFKKLWSNSKSVSASCYVFDPTLNTRGAYVVYNASYDTTNNRSSFANKNIQSGQAFFVQTSGSSPSITFKESYKSTVNTRVFRNPAASSNLAIQLLLKAEEGDENNADGVIAFFDNNISTAIGNENSYKFINEDENLAITHNGNSLSLEGRPPVTAHDTIQLKMWQFRQKNYYLRLTGTNFPPDVTAFVQDTYLHQNTPVNLLSVTLFPFTVDTTLPASFAAERFAIIFKAGNILPVTRVNVKAYKVNNGIQVEWTAQTEINAASYEIEESVDGEHFEKSGSIAAKGNAFVNESYSFFDNTTNQGNNFYRIKTTIKTGEVIYSHIVKVIIPEANSNISIFPNPVKGNTFRLQLNNMEKGDYEIIIYNNLGQKVYRRNINHTDESAGYDIERGRLISKGTYRLTVSNGKTKIIETIVFY
jgi:hypothetical protein